jgi:crossover junction endodeoxyribonuclease RuvC
VRILGVDPGTHRMGFGIIEVLYDQTTCLQWGCLEAPKTEPVHRRLDRLYNGLNEVIERWKPQFLAVEEPFVNPERGAKSALILGQAQAVALLLAAKADMEVHRYSATTVKLTVGDHGGATKTQLQRAIQIALRLPQEKIPEDASDALAVALCHWRYWAVNQRIKAV